MAIMQIGGNATSYPTDTTTNWQLGDIQWNNAPTMGAPAGWVCTAAGYPGTWIPFGMIGSGAELTTTATSGTLSSAYTMILLNPASTGTYTLPQVTAYANGGSLFIKNIASGSTTLTPIASSTLGTNTYEATSIAAITLAQNARVTLRSSGGTVWYLQST